MDESNAAERLGVPPRQVVDFLALVGDRSDNVPGVKGIGEKGAQKLLAEYGDLETLLARAGEVTAKRTREALLAQADNARLSRELVTIKRDVPVALDVADLVLQEPDREAADPAPHRAGVLLAGRKLGAGEGDGAGTARRERPAPIGRAGRDARGSPARRAVGLDRRREACRDRLARPRRAGRAAGHRRGRPRRAFRPWSRALRAAPLVALDAETSSLTPHERRAGRPVARRESRPRSGISRSPIGPPGRRARRRPTAGEEPAAARRPRARAARARCSTDPAVPKAGHNIKYDWQVLRGAGVELAGVAYDSMLASFVLDPGRRSHAIDKLCLEHLGPRRCRPTHDVAGRGEGARSPSPRCRSRPRRRTAAPTAPRCSRCTSSSRPRSARCAMEPLLRDDRDAAGARCWSTWSGTASPSTGQLFTRLERRAGRRPPAARGRDRRAWPGVELNLNSPRQLATVLFEKQQLPVLKKTKTGPVHRRRRAGAARGDGARAAAADPRVSRAAEAQEHLRGHAAGDRQPAAPAGSTPASTRPAPRPAGSARPIPTCRTSRSARRAARRSGAGFVPARGLDLPGGRLLPDRAAPHGASLGGSGLHRGVPPGRRHPPADRGAHLQRAGRAGDAGDARPGQDHQLRHHLRPGTVRAEPAARHHAGGRQAPSSPTTSSASPACAPSSTGRSSWPGSRATWRRSSSAGATSPRSATATSTCGPTASGTRRTRRSRARRPT